MPIERVIGTCIAAIPEEASANHTLSHKIMPGEFAVGTFESRKMKFPAFRQPFNIFVVLCIVF